MATLNFPDSPDTGDIYSDSNSGFTYEWNGTVWISKDPSTASNIREIDDISSGFNGSTTAFTLQVASVNVEPANVQQLIISVGGVMQNAGDDYTVSGSTLTFTTAPTSGLTFFGTLLGTALSLNTVADGSVTVSSLSTTTNYIMGGLTADQNAGFVTAYGLVAGAGGVNVSGAVTGGSFSGDGSGLTGVASTDNIITSYGATFLSNVRVAGIFTAANAYVTGILTAQTLNYNNVVDIYSTGIITATRGIQQTGNEGLHVSAGISTVGILTATKATVGLGVTVNNTGIDAGIGAGIITAKDYYGNASNMTGIGITVDIIGSSPLQGSQNYSTLTPVDQISFNLNQGIKAGNAAKEIELRHSSATGNIVQSFGVGSSVTYSFGQALISPTGIGITNEETYYVVVPDGGFEAVGGGNSSGIVNTYSFSTKNYTYERWVTGRNNLTVFGGGGEWASPSQYVSSPTQVGSSAGWTDFQISAQGNWALARKNDGTLWSWGGRSNGKLGYSVGGGNPVASPMQIGTDPTWGPKFNATAGMAFAIKTDGTLWAWGANEGGSLGQNDNVNHSSPMQVGTDTTWFCAGAGQENRGCVAAVKTDGTLWSWGHSTTGALGQNAPNSGGDVYLSSPTQIGTATDWYSCKVGGGGVVLASKNTTANVGRFDDKQGELWVWGSGNSYSLGLGNETSRSSPCQLPGTTWDVVNPQSSSRGSVNGVTKTNGTLYMIGSNTTGALGQNNRTIFSSPKQVGTETDWKSSYVSTGAGGAVVAQKTDGTLWFWGENNKGQLGVNDRQERSSPVQMETSSSLAEWSAFNMGGDGFMGATRTPA